MNTPKHYSCTITYSAGIRNAKAVISAPVWKTGVYAVNDGDTIGFAFDGPGANDVQGHLTLTQPAADRIASVPDPVVNGTVWTIGLQPGAWSFAMNFAAYVNGVPGEPHFLPDPELQVGS